MITDNCCARAPTAFKHNRANKRDTIRKLNHQNTDDYLSIGAAYLNTRPEAGSRLSGDIART